MILQYFPRFLQGFCAVLLFWHFEAGSSWLVGLIFPRVILCMYLLPYTDPIDYVSEDCSRLSTI